MIDVKKVAVTAAQAATDALEAVAEEGYAFPDGKAAEVEINLAIDENGRQVDEKGTANRVRISFKVTQRKRARAWGREGESGERDL